MTLYNLEQRRRVNDEQQGAQTMIGQWKLDGFGKINSRYESRTEYSLQSECALRPAYL